MVQNYGTLSVCTVTSGEFQNYIPIFIYTLRKAAPRAIARCLHRGELNEDVRGALRFLQSKGVRYDAPIENYKTDFPHNKSTTNCLRFLIEPSYLRETFMYITDVDFIFLPHEPPLDQYYIERFWEWGQCYWARRGFKRIVGSNEKAKRIAGGGVLVTADWFQATERLRGGYLEQVKDGTLGTVREDDEKMLWYLCAGSELKLPTKRGNRRKRKYKEIHIGDFKFDHRVAKKKKMKKKIPKGNYYKWHRLEEDPVWLELVEMCCKSEMVKDSITSLRTYMNDRKLLTLEN